VSVIIPAYNEEKTIVEIIRRVQGVPLDKEIIVVDDSSADATPALLRQLERQYPNLRVFRHDVNQGKGAAVRTGLGQVQGEVVIIQDADLEYDPTEYPVLLRPIEQGRSKVVYGSRFLGEHKAMYFWHSVGNKFLTLVTNVLYNSTLTDMETCYKVFTADVAARIHLRSNRWGFDPEITAKILKTGNRIYEVPISYTGREFFEGKKIAWHDALTVLWTLLKFRFVD
jgi:glycosyltransferase involved in cell wall biosynthesis